MNRFRRFASLLGLGTLYVSSAAHAISPITTEQRLCSGATYVFVGRIISIVSKDCRLSNSPAYRSDKRKDDLELSIRVSRILGVWPDRLNENPSLALREG